MNKKLVFVISLLFIAILFAVTVNAMAAGNRDEINPDRTSTPTVTNTATFTATNTPTNTPTLTETPADTSTPYPFITPTDAPTEEFFRDTPTPTPVTILFLPLSPNQYLWLCSWWPWCDTGGSVK